MFFGIITIVSLFLIGSDANSDASKIEGTLLNVNGRAKVERKPNLAVLNIKVDTKGSETGSASEEHKKTMLPIRAAVLGFIAKHHAATDKILHETLTVKPEYHYQNGQNKIVGFVASTSMSVQVDEIDEIGTLVSQLTKSGAMIQGVTFKLKEKEKSEALEEARELAVKDAHANAKTFARAVDLQVVRIVSISDGSSSSGGARPQAYGMLPGSAERSAGHDASTPSTDPGVLSFVSNVHMQAEAQ